MEKKNSADDGKDRELPILQGDMTEASSNATSSVATTSTDQVGKKAVEQKAADERTVQLQSKSDIIDKAAAVAEDVTRKAIMKSSADKGAETFGDKLKSVAKSVGINTMKGLAAYVIPKIISTVVAGAPTLLGLCSNVLDDPVMGPLYAKIIKHSICDDDYLEQVNTNTYAGVRSLVMTAEQGTVVSRNTTFNVSSMISFALGMMADIPYTPSGEAFATRVTGHNCIRFDPKSVSNTRYMFIDWAQRYKDMYSGTDIGPLLRDARQFVDFYDLAVTVGVIKLLLGEPDQLKFSASEPLIKLFLYINSYYAKPVGNETHWLRGSRLTKSANPQADTAAYPMSRNAVGVFPINAWMTTISQWTSYLAANVAAPAPVFRDTGSYGSSVAVVPILTSMYANPRGLALWTALYLEYPYRLAGEQYEYCDEVGLTIKSGTNAGLPSMWCPDASLVWMPGVKSNVLYVLIDANVDAAAPVFGIVQQDQVAGVDISAQLDAVINVNGVARNEMYQSGNSCLKWWRSMFGSTDDWRDATIAAADGSVHTFVPTVCRDNVLLMNGHRLAPLPTNNADLMTGISSAPAGYTQYIVPGAASTATLGTQRITPFGSPSGTYLGRANWTPMAASKPTELQYPQYSHALGPFVAAKLFIPINRAKGHIGVNPTQQFYSQIRLGMYITAFTDYFRGQRGLAMSALMTDMTPGDLDQYTLYVQAIDHFARDLFGTDLRVLLNGCTLARAAGEYAGLGDNEPERRSTSARLLPTFVHSMLSRTAICPTDRLDVPPEAFRWRSGSVRGFSFPWLSIRDKPFYDNLLEYNTYGPTTNAGAIALTPTMITSWSKIWNVGWKNNVKWYDLDLLRLPMWWNLIPQMEYQGVIYSDVQLTTLPVSGFVYISASANQERSITTDLIVSNDNLEAANSIVLRDKTVHNVGASIRNTPWSSELGVNVTFDLLV